MTPGTLATLYEVLAPEIKTIATLCSRLYTGIIDYTKIYLVKLVGLMESAEKESGRKGRDNRGYESLELFEFKRREISVLVPTKQFNIKGNPPWFLLLAVTAPSIPLPLFVSQFRFRRLFC